MRMAVLAASILGLSALGFAVAQEKEKLNEKGGDKPVARSAAGKMSEDLSAAFRLAEYGREKKAPEVLIAAARVIGTTDTKDFEPAEKGAKVPGEKFDGQKEANALLDQAVKMAGGNDAIKKLAEETRKVVKEGERGIEGGPQTRNGSVGPNDPQDTFVFTAKGGESTFIIVNNRSNKGDIDLVVVDETGRVLKRDTRRDDDARVSFYVPQNTRIYVKVKCYRNDGQRLHYTLQTD